jgi:hypothetical protein
VTDEPVTNQAICEILREVQGRLRENSYEVPNSIQQQESRTMLLGTLLARHNVEAILCRSHSTAMLYVYYNLGELLSNESTTWKLTQ